MRAGIFGWGGGGWNRLGDVVLVPYVVTNNYQSLFYGVLRGRFDRPGRAVWAACGCLGEGSIQGTNRGVEQTGLGLLGRKPKNIEVRTNSD